MKRYSSFIIVFIVLCGCSAYENPSNKAEAFQLHFIDSLEFNTGFSFMDRPSGSFYDEDSEQLCYYFGNLSTNKTIKVFSKEGVATYTVQLDSVKALASIEEVEIWSMDTILALSQYSGKLFFLNRKGEVWRQVDLSTLLENDSVWYTELSSSYFSKMNVSKNAIVLSLNAAIQPSVRSEKGIQFYTEQVWQKPQLVRFNSIFSDSISAHTGFSMYQVIAPEEPSFLNIEVKSFVVTNELIYAHSYYSDKVFQLDAKTLNLQEEFKLRSDYKLIGERLNTKGKQDGEIFGLMQKGNGGGMIARHFFSEQKGHHYFVISIDEDSWSLLIYNETFQRIGEQKFLDEDYLSFMFPSEHGIYLQKATEVGQNYHTQKLVFHEFSY